MDKNDNKTKNSLLHTMYHARVDGALEESLRKDQHYQRVNKEANQKIRKVERLKLNQKQWRIVDIALSASNERSSEYGRVAYQQGFKDAVALLMETRFWL